jgi:A/G-specific adenine glycosylase
MIISKALTNWYKIHKRSLPWRKTADPYKIWVSEIILQQTRVNQGTDYYHQFIEKFPDIRSLANADQDEVLKLWQGLGYYNRARNMHHTARYVLQNYDGELPANYNELLNLKGIGPYTAAAIASFAFDEAVAVVDGNVKRVLTRVFGIKEPINTTKAEKTIQEIANQTLDTDSPGEHNQALIEFGALQCVPKKPACSSCPLSEICEAYNQNMVQSLPVKSPPKKKKNRYFYYLVINHSQKYIFINKRTQKDVWNSLYEFPLIEREKRTDIEALTQSKEWGTLLNATKPLITNISNEYKHVLSHQNIFATFLEIQIKKPTDFLIQNYTSIDREELGEYAVSRLIERYLQGG